MKKILNLILETFLSFFQKIWKRRLIFIMLVSVIAVIVVILSFTVLNKKEQVIVKASEQTPVNINKLQIIVPNGAFPSNKKFIIKEIDKNSEIYTYATKNEDFVSEMYEVSPEDDKEELALLPLTLRYNVPKQYYLGDNFYNLSLGYLDRDTKIVRRFYGSELIKDGENIYIEAKTFHTSIIGLIAKKPTSESFGLKKVVDKPENYKPYILVVPGIDENFTGAIPNTYSDNEPLGKNFWEILFPDRSIWLYRYPLKDSRPNIYVEASRSFFREFGRTDYIVYEAKRLSTELKRIPFKFDVIAHGIGGLIVRYAIESDPTIKNVRRVVLISTPNLGTNLVNPVYLNALYGKSDSALAEIYGLNTDSISYIKNIVTDYLEKINVFWESLKPGSKTLEELNSFGMRNDIDYLALCGTSINFPINIQNSELAKFYPEFLEGTGDGIVTVSSATLNGKLKSKVFNYSFHELYLQKDVLETIREYLEDIDVPEPYTFKTDDFKEKLQSESEVNSEFFSTETTTENTLKKPDIPPETSHSTFKSTSTAIQSKVKIEGLKNDRNFRRFYPETVNLAEITEECRKIAVLSNRIFILCKENLYRLENKGKLVKLSDTTPDSFFNVWKNSVFLYSDSKIKIFDRDGNLISTKKLSIEDNDLLDVFMTSFRIYTLLKEDHDIIFKIFDHSGNLMSSKKIRGIRAHFKYSEKYNQLFIVSNDEILCYDVSNDQEIFVKTESSFRKYASFSSERRLEFVDLERISEWLIILTKEYEIFANNLLNGEVINLGFGDVGSEKLIFDTLETIYVLGEKTINFLDFKENTVKREEKYVKFDENVIINGTVFNKELYLILSEGTKMKVVKLKFD